MAEVVVDGRTGRLVGADDRDALASGIDQIVGDPERARRMGAEARRHAQTRFSLEDMLDAYEPRYERLTRARLDARA